MTETHRPRVKYVIGPDGSPLTIADLPAPGTKRWVIRRKAEVVAAVRGGLLSLEEACARYTLTVEEFLSWQASIDQHGLAGLSTTRIQQYRAQRQVPYRVLKRRPRGPAFGIRAACAEPGQSIARAMPNMRQEPRRQRTVAFGTPDVPGANPTEVDHETYTAGRRCCFVMPWCGRRASPNDLHDRTGRYRNRSC